MSPLQRGAWGLASDTRPRHEAGRPAFRSRSAAHARLRCPQPEVERALNDPAPVVQVRVQQEDEIP